MENLPAIALTTMRNSYSGKKEQSIFKHCSGYSRDMLLTSHLTDVRKASSRAFLSAPGVERVRMPKEHPRVCVGGNNEV